MNEEAVSEIIGFIIIFGIVVTSIGIVYANAVPQLQESREVENVQNAERAFSVLQNNIDDVAVRQAPSRSTQIRLQGSSIDIRRLDSYINITVHPKSGTPFFMDANYSSIVYTNTNDLRIVYENGAVFRSIRDGGSGMTYKPNWRINSREVVLPIIDTRGEGQVSGTSTVLLRAEDAGLAEKNVTQVDEVNITIKSPRADGWEIYMRGFESDGLAADVGRSGDTVYMRVDTAEKSVLTQRKINMGIER